MKTINVNYRKKKVIFAAIGFEIPPMAESQKLLLKG